MGGRRRHGDRGTAVDRFTAALRRATSASVCPPGSTVVAAVSGGADSVALAAGWRLLLQERGDALHIAHFDHRLRSDSEDDVRFVGDLASTWNVPFHCGSPESSLRDAPGGSLENAARRARYAFLGSVARSVGASVILTAHNRDDQIETVLHRVLRGAGWSGLAGIPAVRPLVRGVDLLRPMLAVPRTLVEGFLGELRQP
ncbi:MAG: tRNA lysidine(34) synthetase TilS, partial [Planctomycetia bacterium]